MASDKLQSALERSIESLPGRLQAVEACVKDGSAAAPDVIKDALLAAHSLAGSAAVFDRASLGEVAREMEDLLECLKGASKPIPPSFVKELSDKFAMLQQTAALSPDFCISNPEEQGVDAMAPRLPDNSSRRVLLLEDDIHLAEELCRQLAAFDWEVDAVSSSAQALAKLRQHYYLAIIADVMLPEGPLAGTELADALPSGVSLPPTIFMSRRWDWEARLASVRADAVSYLNKPVDTARLAELLAQIQQPDDHNAGRIVLVDDDDILTSHYFVVLQNAGHRVIVLQDPSKLLEVLPTFNPDLLVLDLHMRDCSGIEVAKVIRQDDANTGLPILFLSSDRSQRPQRDAIKAGADDFLLKPISDEWLVAAVEARVKRSRAIQALSQRDSMTGLLNHLSIVSEVEQEAIASSRSGAAACFAMLDIDLFKQVNDTYGHPVGDRVIRAMAHLLRQRIRRSDAVGRYGGEEFALVLRDTPLDKAGELLDGLRQRFAAIQFSCGEDTFTSSISIGICQLRTDETVDSIVKRADDALYSAKRHGRNQVALAP